MADACMVDREIRKEWRRSGHFEHPLSRENLNQVHDASIAVLARTGFQFNSETVVSLFRERGFQTRSRTVYFSEKDILRALETVPGYFTILARNPENNIFMDPFKFSFGLGRGAVHIVEPDGSYHRGTKKDVIESTKLSQSLETLEHWNPLTYPVDVERENLQLWLQQTAITYSDKPYLYIGREDIDLVALGYGTTREKMADREDFSQSYGRATGMVNSPLTMSKYNCDNLLEYARCGIAVHIASMPVAGTSGPCSLAGTIVQQNCENLAPIVLAQLVRPGCPVFYGAIGGRTDMQSLNPRFGTPEARLIERAGAQMARMYGLRCRGGAGLTDSPSSDFQAGAQAMLSMIAVLQDGPDYLPSCGLLGSYVGASLAKIILDVDLIKQARYYLAPIHFDSSSLALDVIDEVGAGGHFIEHEHTAERFRNEFLVDSIFTSPGYAEWATQGEQVLVHRAFEAAHRIIAAYEKPPIDQGLEEELDEYVKTHWVG